MSFFMLKLTCKTTEIQMKLKPTVKILGTHNGRHLIETEKGYHVYFSEKSGKTGINPKSLARILGCDVKTIMNAGVKLTVLKEYQMYTQQGIQGVKIILDKDIPSVLEYLTKGRHGKKTKASAAKLLKDYAEKGFRLDLLLEIAPEEVVNQVIDKIEDKDALLRISVRAESKVARLNFTNAIKNQIEQKEAIGLIIATSTNEIYTGLWHKPAKTLRREKNIKKSASLRDTMTNSGLTAVMMVESVVAHKLGKNPDIKDFDIPKATREVSDDIRELILKHS